MIWVYGKLVKWGLPLHIKKEVLPYSIELGLSKEEIRALFHIELDKILDEALK